VELSVHVNAPQLKLVGWAMSIRIGDPLDTNTLQDRIPMVAGLILARVYAVQQYSMCYQSFRWSSAWEVVRAAVSKCTGLPNVPVVHLRAIKFSILVKRQEPFLNSTIDDNHHLELRPSSWYSKQIRLISATIEREVTKDTRSHRLHPYILAVLQLYPLSPGSGITQQSTTSR